MRSLMYPRGGLFLYSAYWGKWSRVLQFMNKDMWQVEVDLTPVIGLTSDWLRVERLNIREHGTARDARDVITADLPDHVVETMRTRLPEELVQRLLHEDFLSNIDWTKYNAKNNGGASFFDICK